MSQQLNKTQNYQKNFMGVVVDLNGPTNPMLLKALANSTSLLDIFKFVEITKFKLNIVMFDYFCKL